MIPDLVVIAPYVLGAFASGAVLTWLWLRNPEAARNARAWKDAQILQRRGDVQDRRRKSVRLF